MTTYCISPGDLHILQGKTILITGGATGIGRAAVDIALGKPPDGTAVAGQHGANVAIGDWNEKLGTEIAEQFKKRVLFRKCDVSNWDDVLNLFQDATKRFGIIHSVLSNAGINTHEDLLSETFDSEGKLLPPALKSIDVNLVGQLFVVRCAMHYFAKWPGIACQLILTSSAGAFFPAPPIYMYCAAKCGVLGLMRAMRSEVTKRNVTINTVAPWLTVTPMLLEGWLKGWNLPKNTAEGVAAALFLPVLQPVNGKSFFVAGDKITELEDSLFETEPLWMGEQLCHDVRKGQDILLGNR